MKVYFAICVHVIESVISLPGAFTWSWDSVFAWLCLTLCELQAQMLFFVILVPVPPTPPPMEDLKLIMNI